MVHRPAHPGPRRVLPLPVAPSHLLGRRGRAFDGRGQSQVVAPDVAARAGWLAKCRDAPGFRAGRHPHAEHRDPRPGPFRAVVSARAPPLPWPVPGARRPQLWTGAASGGRSLWADDDHPGVADARRDRRAAEDPQSAAGSAGSRTPAGRCTVANVAHARPGQPHRHPPLPCRRSFEGRQLAGHSANVGAADQRVRPLCGGRGPHLAEPAHLRVHVAENGPGAHGTALRRGSLGGFGSRRGRPRRRPALQRSHRQPERSAEHRPGPGVTARDPGWPGAHHPDHCHSVRADPAGRTSVPNSARRVSGRHPLARWRRHAAPAGFEARAADLPGPDRRPGRCGRGR